MNDKSRVAFCGLFLALILGVCSMLFVLIGSRLTPVNTAPLAAGQRTHTTQDDTAADASQIRILDTVFSETQIAEGQVIYTQYCSPCHGIDGQGQFPAAPLEPDPTGRIGAPPHNETGHSWHHSDVLLIRYVTEGGFSDPTRYYTMPPFAQILTDEQILLVLAFIKTMWTDDQRASQRQLTEDEERMFSN